MIEKSTIDIVIETFFDYPTRTFHLRELSRLTKLSMPTIISTTDILAKESIIIKVKGKVLTTLSANRESAAYTALKRINNLKRIYLLGIIDNINDKYSHPKIIILFGSYSRGEDTEKSDIDIAVITSTRKTVNLSDFEGKLKRNISIHEVNLNKISDDFRKNLANGIVLEGSW